MRSLSIVLALALTGICREAQAQAPAAGPAAADRQPGATLASLFTDRDYPRAAVRARQEGLVGFTLSISAAGRVDRCVVTRSSGFALLDDTTCRVLRQRARFSPARDARGKPIPDTKSGSVMWRLPR